MFIKDDIQLQQKSKLEDIFRDFIQSKVEACRAKNIRRVTFYLAAKVTFKLNIFIYLFYFFVSTETISTLLHL